MKSVNPRRTTRQFVAVVTSLVIVIMATMIPTTTTTTVGFVVASSTSGGDRSSDEPYVSIAGYQTMSTASQLETELQLNHAQFKLQKILFDPLTASEVLYHHHTFNDNQVNTELNKSFRFIGNDLEDSGMEGDHAFMVCHKKPNTHEHHHHDGVFGWKRNNNHNNNDVPDVDHCPYPEYAEMIEYYGHLNYGYDWLQAAVKGTVTHFDDYYKLHYHHSHGDDESKNNDTFFIDTQDIRYIHDDHSNNKNHQHHHKQNHPTVQEERATAVHHKGDEDFSALTVEGRASAIATGTITLQLYMKMYRLMTEEAVDVCRSACHDDQNNDDEKSSSKSSSSTMMDSLELNTDVDEYFCQSATKNWDRAVAAYVGTIDSNEDDSSPMTRSKGHLWYSMANSLAADFGVESINENILRSFQNGQKALSAGHCEAASRVQRRITQTMHTTLVQGVLKHAWELSQNDGHDLTDESITQQRHEHWGAGAAYTASLLPLMHHCSKSDAKLLDLSMKIGGEGDPSYESIREALERNYECLGIDPDKVGSYTKSTGSKSPYHSNPNFHSIQESSLFTETSQSHNDEKEEEESIKKETSPPHHMYNNQVPFKSIQESSKFTESAPPLDTVPSGTKREHVSINDDYSTHWFGFVIVALVCSLVVVAAVVVGKNPNLSRHVLRYYNGRINSNNNHNNDDNDSPRERHAFRFSLVDYANSDRRNQRTLLDASNFTEYDDDLGV